MGDVGDDYRMWREELKRRKEERRSINKDKLHQIDIPYSIGNNGTIHFKTPQGKVLFYPSVNKYQYKQTVKLGPLEAAVNLAKKLGAK
ncbi:hypothetical protein [Xenorhabdus szentirmaii]|uniref:Uncharacterized protein n=1 Tax=Xenorhabdus szentirmaii TaxID=290112 RepID=A0AAW3Z235_9GAMM|nr:MULTISPECIES: hypothetical protein [Xenorhabdus]MBD2803057.1 hypothetical protein [Xenorhabdus sp. M]MBD2804085.1 hypothetical protein [Xenorhabdus sp. ZM]MBD2827226.1 hypothetical protein [Xenorhabdus sp. 5]PHM42382.1 hypothetical protein Xszus_02116 [Xenorhabdus szentirmaii]